MRHSNITEMGVWSYGHAVPIPSCLLQYIPPEIPCFPSPPLTWLAPCSAQYPVGQSQIRAGRKPRFRCSRAFKKAGSTSNQILAQKAIAKLLAQFYFTGWIWPPCACRDLKVERERERERPYYSGFNNKACWLFKGLHEAANLSLWLLHFPGILFF